ncbi:MAG: hypothetical protein EOO90_04225 [Pedobacter sp.]|nr:MAG: hypothetical protein EOO90_04225 [Pedobacter sp.]
MCKKTIIAKRKEVTITQCVNCNVVNIWKTGLLMRFTGEQFVEFLAIARKIEFDDYSERTPSGKEVVILSTPCNDMCLMFTREELLDFTAAMEEAQYMRSIYQLVHFN